MFVGENLTNIRMIYGFTRKQLGELLGVTEQAVWQYENGFVSPKMTMVLKLKEIFNVKSKYFYKENIMDQQQDNVVNLNHIAYRSSTINSVQKTQFEAVHIEKLINFIGTVSNKVQFPKNELITLRNDIMKLINNEGNRQKGILKAAEYARSYIGLEKGSNHNLLFLLEKSGAFIFEKSLGDKIDAYSLWSNKDVPYIMLGNLKKSAVRRNFDLAHELGHLLMHYKVEFPMLEKKCFREYEHEANLFAGAFLLPEDEFVQDINLISKISHPDSYTELKDKWKVSIQAMAFRAHFLKCMTYQQYRYFNIKLNELNYREIEPLDQSITVSKPGKLRSILQLLFEQKQLSLETVLDTMEVEIPFLTKLTGIESNFFEKHLESHQSFTVKDLNLIR
ncbi:MAG TPA: XRE family transcriptional regulator [Pseudogracilibacillus sp.]|nr:XRE family transcriptional regulator [Pseudogracilibacillus sp.]